MPESNAKQIIFLVFILGGIVYSLSTRNNLNSQYGQLFYRMSFDCQPECSSEDRLHYLKKSVFYHPSLAQAYYQMGSLFEELGNDKTAFLNYQQAIRFGFDHYTPYRNAGRIELRSGNVSGGLKYLIQAKERREFDSETLELLGQIYESKGEKRKAAEEYVRIHPDYPGFDEIQLKLAGIYYDLELEKQDKILYSDLLARLRLMNRHDLIELIENNVQN